MKKYKALLDVGDWDSDLVVVETKVPTSLLEKLFGLSLLSWGKLNLPRKSLIRKSTVSKLWTTKKPKKVSRPSMIKAIEQYERNKKFFAPATEKQKATLSHVSGVVAHIMTLSSVEEIYGYMCREWSEYHQLMRKWEETMAKIKKYEKI